MRIKRGVCPLSLSIFLFKLTLAEESLCVVPSISKHTHFVLSIIYLYINHKESKLFIFKGEILK
jgi:hypothetical protein